MSNTHPVKLKERNNRIVVEGDNEVKYLERDGASFTLLASIRRKINATSRGWIPGRLEVTSKGVMCTLKNRKGLLWKVGSTIGISDDKLRTMIDKAKSFKTQKEWGQSISELVTAFEWNSSNPNAFYNHLTHPQRIAYWKFRTEVIDKLPEA